MLVLIHRSDASVVDVADASTLLSQDEYFQLLGKQVTCPGLSIATFLLLC
jgi:hypothetical protein